jgi:hypothetical protein
MNLKTSPFPKNFTNEFKTLIDEMLNKNSRMKPSIEILIEVIFHKLRQDFLYILPTE